MTVWVTKRGTGEQRAAKRDWEVLISPIMISALKVCVLFYTFRESRCVCAREKEKERVKALLS